MSTKKEVNPTTKENTPQQPQVVIQEKQSKSRGCLYGALVFLIGLVFISVCSFGSFFIFALSSQEGNVLYEGSEDKIALIKVEGVISSSQQQSLFGGSIGSSDQVIVEQLQNAADDPYVKAILLHIESPGGEAVASDIISRKVLEVREEKPVVAYSSTMAASGGYMIASSSNKFVVHPGDLTGSIGVIMQTSSLEGLYEKLGIENVTIKSDRFKDNQELFEKPEGELMEIYQGIIDEAYDQFVDIIVEGRGMDESLVRELGDGRLYSGKQAVENGLADFEGYYEDAIEVTEDLAGIENATVVDYSDSYYWYTFFGSSTLNQLIFKQSGNEYVGVYYLPDITK